MASDPRRRDFLRSATGLASALLVPALGCEAKPSRRTSAREHAARPQTPWGPAAGPAPSEAAPGIEGLPDGLDPLDFTMYSRTPLTLETKRSRLPIEALTATTKLFVRNNLPMPHPRIIDEADRWELRVAGVQAERSFTLAQLKQLGSASVVSVLQCSGNGRRYFEHGPSGSPWGVGAAGCVRWTGVPVAAVIAAAGGALTSANFLTATGGDPLPTLPAGITPEMLVVERSIPLEKGLADCILAWEIGGAPIPISHGGPLRLIVPGYYGVNNIKYVKTLACTERQSSAKIQASSYRLRPLGEPGSASQPSMWRMQVKSWIGGPGADLEPVVAGPHRLRGVAFSGERGVARVEVSIDGGGSWIDAELDGPDLGPNAWRPFYAEVELAVGTHRLVSRATDTMGEAQPAQRVENERGYGNNSWRDMALEIEAFATAREALAASEAERAAERAAEEATQESAELSDKAKRGREVFIREASPACGNCHTLADADAGMKIGPNLDTLGPSLPKVENALNQGVGVMQSYRGQLTPEQIDAVANYVVEAARKR